MNPSRGVMIGKMHLHGDTRHKDALLQSLDSQFWLGDDDERIIFIKKIHVQGQWWDVGQKIAQASNELVVRANRYPNVNDGADVVAFNNRAQLVAHLITNMLEGKTTWYQQRWLQQSGVGANPVALLTHQVFDIPDVLYRLQQDQKLGNFFQRCNVDNLKNIIQAILSLCPLPMAQLNHLLSGQQLNQMAREVPGIDLPVTQQRWVAAYLSASITVLVEQQAQNSLLLIISLLSLWKFNPHQLRSVDVILQRLANVNAIYRRHFTYPRTNAVQPADNSPLLITRAAGNASNGLIENAVIEDEKVLQEPLPAMGDIEQPEYWLINHGGFFFLLNYLRNSHAAQSIPVDISPWQWFAQLVRKLSANWSLAIDKNLQLLLCEIGQLANDESSFACEEGSSHESDKSCLMALEFLQRKLTALDLWGAEWISINARVTVEQAYIHIYIDQSAVRTDVRMAGLDINPGWMPWLGRVIYFHYGNYPELAQCPVSL